MKKLILAIETSCDETSLALVEANGPANAPRFNVLENLIASQIDIHRPFGGVVPNLAKREHLKNLPILYKKIEASLKSKLQSKLLPITYYLKPNLIAVTVGPGLEPALWTGITFAKELGKELNIPVLGANHMEGHLYSFLLEKTVSTKHKTRSTKKKPVSDFGFRNSDLPAIALIVSGGHTILLLLKNLTTWKKLGETRDDAVGEAFDKVARILGLPYPGGPEIEKLSRKGKPIIEFPRPMMHDNSPAGEYDFSFSGLKTSVLYYVRDNKRAKKADIAASFQQAAIDVLAHKTFRAVNEYNAKSIILCGGVAANNALRARLTKESKSAGAKFFAPDFEFNTDNAAMIAAASYLAFLRGKKYPLVARGDLNI